MDSNGLTRRELFLMGNALAVPTLFGRLDASLEEALSQPGAILILDLRRTSFIDCMSAGRLLAAHERARRAGRQLVVIRPAPLVQLVFEATGADQTLLFVERPADPAHNALLRTPAGRLDYVTLEDARDAARARRQSGRLRAEDGRV